MGKKDAGSFVASPLSIGMLDPKANRDVARWIEEVSPDKETTERLRTLGARGKRDGKHYPRLSEMTVKDLSRPALPWSSFFGWDAGKLRDSYSLFVGIEAAKERTEWMEINIVHYIRNYMVVVLICTCCVLYKRPLAIAGLAVVAKAWDWLREYGMRPGMDSHPTKKRRAHAAVTIFTWVVLMFTQATTAIFIALFASGIAVCSHAAIRKPPGFG
mmetsp:Transcript_4938/g.16094  ORF Transcript_4938/g.16094 Transcript_4938/m.16094 type:complete len:215 (+) Transcript_4938:219-863(+)